MKKLLPLILASVLTLSLAACGGGDTPRDTSAPPADTEESPAPETPPKADSEPPADLEPEPEEEDETPEATAIPLEIGGSIDNDQFLWTFDSLDLFSEYAFQTGESTRMSIAVEEGYQLLMVKGHFENRGTSVIPTSAFVLSVVVNDTYEVDGTDVHLDFTRQKYFEIDPYTDQDCLLYINIPNKLADTFETATFNISFNDDLSSPSVVWGSDGESQVEADQVYALTSGIVPASEGGDGGIAATGESGDSEDAEPAAASTLGSWSVNYYVDDFQQPTEDWYITTGTQLSGTFSDSATTNSVLLAQIFYGCDDYITIFLWEYGRIQVKNPSSNYVDEYDIVMRDQSGTDQKLSGTVYCGGDRVVVEGADKDKVIAALRQPGTVSFYIVNSDYATTNYLFSVETDNFASVYDAQMGTQTA